MTNWDGRHGKGARKVLRAEQRREAEQRNALTPVHRSRSYREGPVPVGSVARTSRSVQTYRGAFVDAHGAYPEETPGVKLS